MSTDVLFDAFPEEEGERVRNHFELHWDGSLEFGGGGACDGWFGSLTPEKTLELYLALDDLYGEN